MGVARVECVVVGAGPGGLGTAAMLSRRGVTTTVLERGGGVGAKWRHSYDRLHINTSAWFSHLPGPGFRRRGPLDQLGEWPGDTVDLVDATDANGCVVEVHAVTSADDGHENREDGEDGEDTVGGDDERRDLLLRGRDPLDDRASACEPRHEHEEPD